MKISLSLLIGVSLWISNSHAQTLRLGKVSFPNSGKPEAQGAFLNGLAALHCFWYPKALEQFREAKRMDPQFALASWGEAMTYNHPVWHQQNLAAGRAALRTLGASPEEQASKGKNEIEKALIRSLALLYGKGSKEERDEKYKGALEQLYRKFPKNIEIASFYSLSILGTARSFEGNFDKQMEAAKIMESFLPSSQPDVLQHPGLLHYLIHAYDHPRYAEKAIGFANLYSKVSADSSHALHMPSHIFLQLGLWEKVADQNQDSYATSVKWAKLDKKGYPEHDFHALYWLLYAYLQQGRFKDAEGLLSQMKTIAQDDPSERNEGYLGMMNARYVIETQQWDRLSLPKTLPEIRDRLNHNLHAGCVGAESEHNRISTLSALGIAGTRLAQPKLTEEAIRQIRQLKDIYPRDNGQFDQRVLDIQTQALSGLLEISKGRKEKGLQLLKLAADLENQLDPPSGLPVPAKPATELYAETLLELNQPSTALKAFKKSLERTPNRTLSLLGAFRSSKLLKFESESDFFLKALQSNLVKADSHVRKVILD